MVADNSSESLIRDLRAACVGELQADMDRLAESYRCFGWSLSHST
jgi:hypothetical protein